MKREGAHEYIVLESSICLQYSFIGQIMCASSPFMVQTRIFQRKKVKS